MKKTLLLLCLAMGWLATACATGGGSDAGAVQDEVGERAPSRVCRGDYFINGCPDWQGGCTTSPIEAVEACTEVVGILSFWNAPNAESIELPALRSVKGWMGIAQNSNLKSISMPSLAYVTGELHVSDNTVLEHIDFSALTTLEGQLYIERNSILKTLELARLTAVSDRIRIENNFALETIRFPLMTRLRAATIARNRALTTLAMANLEEVEDQLDIDRNGRLANVHFGSLQKASKLIITGSSGADLRLGALREIGDLHLVQVSGLTELRLPALESANTLLLESNRRLSTIELSRLDKVGILRLRDNVDLRRLELPELREVEGWFVLHGNRALSSLSAPQLAAVGHALDITENANLESVEMGTLSRIGYNATAESIQEVMLSTGAARQFAGNFLRLEENSSLPTCQANGLRDGLRGFTGTAKIVDNKRDGCYRPDPDSEEEEDI